jgi:hypothetical protein
VSRELEVRTSEPEASELLVGSRSVPLDRTADVLSEVWSFVEGLLSDQGKIDLDSEPWDSPEERATFMSLRAQVLDILTNQEAEALALSDDEAAALWAAGTPVEEPEGEA